MTINTRAAQPRDPEELPVRLAEYDLTTSAGVTTAPPDEVKWTVILSTDGRQIRRDVRVNGKNWDQSKNGWEPEGTIWPTWPTSPRDDLDLQGAALDTVQSYWDKTGNRLRDSAKWMATVLGAALASLIGTSPLTPFRQHHPLGPIITGLSGLVLLFITLFLVLQVMRPQSVSFADVQGAKPLWHFRPALARWRDIVETHQDLYLPCSVKCLTSLRQSMIIEKMTLMALIDAEQYAVETAGLVQQVHDALEARAVRLGELRTAAAHIAMIGEYYKLRARSTRATYGGILCALLGTAAIIAAFTLLPT